jgi:hypothetical protein
VRPDGSVTPSTQSGRSVNPPGQSVELGAVEEGYWSRVEAPGGPKPALPAANARTAKPAPEGVAQREREERESQRLEDAISRALTETASARPLAPPSPEVPARP